MEFDEDGFGDGPSVILKEGVELKANSSSESSQSAQLPDRGFGNDPGFGSGCGCGCRSGSVSSTCVVSRLEPFPTVDMSLWMREGLGGCVQSVRMRLLKGRHVLTNRARVSFSWATRERRLCKTVNRWPFSTWSAHP